MKRRIAAILTAALVLCTFTGCRGDGLENQSGTSSSVSGGSSLSSDGTSLSSENTSEDPESRISTLEDSNAPESKPTEKVTGIYGETDIPDIPCGDKDHDGKANTLREEDTLKQCLYSMVFETHTFGDYTISLVGDSVRTDKANYPGRIYTQHLRVEVEKNSKKLQGYGGYGELVLYRTQFIQEYILLEDKIGSYLDMYELERPVIAMRYFFDNDSGKTITKTVDFKMIMDSEIWPCYGKAQKGTGVDFNLEGEWDERLVTNTEDDFFSELCIFAADEFKVIDNKTLVDEEAGIRYTFNFSDPPQEFQYITEKIM